MYSRKSSGFTLIELLVVIAIIAILAAILFPVFAKAREKARQTTCLNNQRQIVTAVLLYAQDHDETLPPGGGVWGAIGLDKGALQCPTLGTKVKIGYTYNGGSHLGGQALGEYSDPTQVLVTGDTALTSDPSPSLVNADNNSGTADLVISGDAQRQLSSYYNLNAHGKGLITSYLDGHVVLMKTDTADAVATLLSQINNAHGSGEPYATMYAATNTYYPGCYFTMTVAAPTYCGGGWFNSGGDTFLQAPAMPGFNITFPAAGGTSLTRCINLNMGGISTTDRRCQTALNGAPISATVTMNFAKGMGGDLHILYGAWTDNSDGGASLTVRDNTANKTLTPSMIPDSDISMTYNQHWAGTTKEVIFRVGISQSVTVEVRDTKTAGRAYLMALWIDKVQPRTSTMHFLPG